MRKTPKDVHREVLRREETAFSADPSWYAVWLGVPHAEGSEKLGITERVPDRARWWRAYPVTGEWPATRRGWVGILDWLLEVREGHRRIREHAVAEEGEHVTEW